MKAVAVKEFGTPEGMEIVEMEVPSYAPHQVLIEVEGASINFADVKTRLGKHVKKQLPYIPGIDVMGRVAAVGSAVTNIKPGDRVIAFPMQGSYAEFTTADEQLTFVLPENVPASTAIAAPIVAFTAHFLLNRVTNFQPDESVLIHSAAGGVGLAAVQMARLKGASQIVGTVGTDSKKEAVLEAGADVVMNHQENFQEAFLELTDRRGIDVILDSVSGDVGEKSFKCLADYGRMAVFGNLSGANQSVNTADLTSSCRAVLGFSFGSTRVKKPELLEAPAKEIMALLEGNKLHIPISEELPLAEAAKAHQLLEDRRAIGKVILRMK